MTCLQQNEYSNSENDFRETDFQKMSIFSGEFIFWWLLVSTPFSHPFFHFFKILTGLRKNNSALKSDKSIVGTQSQIGSVSHRPEDIKTIYLLQQYSQTVRWNSKNNLNTVYIKLSCLQYLSVISFKYFTYNKKLQFNCLVYVVYLN